MKKFSPVAVKFGHVLMSEKRHQQHQLLVEGSFVKKIQARSVRFIIYGAVCKDPCPSFNF